MTVATGLSFVAYSLSGQGLRSAGKMAIELGVDRAIKGSGPLGELLKDKTSEDLQKSLGDDRCR